MPLHIMLNIAKFEGSIQSIVNISQCQKSMRRGLQNYRLDLSVHAFTQQQIEACQWLANWSKDSNAVRRYEI